MQVADELIDENLPKKLGLFLSMHQGKMAQRPELLTNSMKLLARMVMPPKQGGAAALSESSYLKSIQQLAEAEGFNSLFLVQIHGQDRATRALANHMLEHIEEACDEHKPAICKLRMKYQANLKQRLQQDRAEEQQQNRRRGPPGMGMGGMGGMGMGPPGMGGDDEDDGQQQMQFLQALAQMMAAQQGGGGEQ